ncbi:MAG: hypothetical protein AABX38_04900 [Candidatus Micrarchaeota archaeon]
MKKCEFLELNLPSGVDQKPDLSQEKIDDFHLPDFSRNIPVSFKRREENGKITTDYIWASPSEENIKIKKLVLSGSSLLDGLYRINLEKEVEIFTLDHNKEAYVFRKTILTVANSLLKMQGSFGAFFETIVGYIQTIRGNVYIISRLIKGSFIFDQMLNCSPVKLLKKEMLGIIERKKLFHLICEKITILNLSGLTIPDFTLNNVALTNDDLFICDLRGLRSVKKKSMFVEQYKSLLRYLVANGLGDRADVYAATSYYCAAVPQACEEWYKEKNKNKNKTSIFDIALKIENEI